MQSNLLITATQGETENVAIIDRWPLFTRVSNTVIILSGRMKQVIVVDRWCPLKQV